MKRSILASSYGKCGSFTSQGKLRLSQGLLWVLKVAELIG